MLNNCSQNILHYKSHHQLEYFHISECIQQQIGQTFLPLPVLAVSSGVNTRGHSLKLYRKETVNRCCERTHLVFGLWIYGILCPRMLYLLRLSTAWKIVLIGIVFTYFTVTTGKISSFKDQSTGRTGLSWTALLLLDVAYKAQAAQLIIFK